MPNKFLEVLGNSMQRVRSLFRRSPKVSVSSSVTAVENEIQLPLERKETIDQSIKASKLVNKIAINFLYYFPQQLGFVMEYVFLFISSQPQLVNSAGLSNTLVETLLIVPVFSLNLGLSTLVSQAVGATQFGVAGFYLLRAIIINLVVFTSCSFLLTYASTVMGWMGSNVVVVEEATRYVTFGFISSVIACIFDMMRNFIQAHQIFRIPALVQCCCTVGLLLLEFLVVKAFGAGLIGLGICKIIGETAKSFILIWYVRRAPKLRQSIVSFRKDYFHLSVLWTQMKKQSFAGSLFFLDWFGFLLMCFVVSGLESNDVSSFFVSFTIITLFNSFADSISAPLGVMIGHAAGGGHVDKVRLYIRVGFIWGVLVALLLSMLMSLVKDVLPWMFTTKEEVVEKASHILYSFCFVFPFYMIQCIMVAIFRSLGKERAASFLLFLSIYLIGVPCSALLGYPLKLGVYGVRYGYAIGILANAFFFGRMLWQLKIEDQVTIISDQLSVDDKKNKELIEQARLREQEQARIRGQQAEHLDKPDPENPPVDQGTVAGKEGQQTEISTITATTDSSFLEKAKELDANVTGISDVHHPQGQENPANVDNGLTDIPLNEQTQNVTLPKVEEIGMNEISVGRIKSKNYATLVEDHAPEEKSEVKETVGPDNGEENQ